MNSTSTVFLAAVGHVAQARGMTYIAERAGVGRESIYTAVAGHKYYIGLSLDNADALDESDWPRQHKWLVDQLNRLYEGLVPLISRMDKHPSTTLTDTGPS